MGDKNPKHPMKKKKEMQKSNMTDQVTNEASGSASETTAKSKKRTYL